MHLFLSVMLVLALGSAAQAGETLAPSTAAARTIVASVFESDFMVVASFRRNINGFRYWPRSIVNTSATRPTAQQ